jgi:antitoxin component of MazEF toxin-antitoxin module
MPVIRKLFRSGNSTVLAIPDHVLNRLALQPGDHIDIRVGIKDNIHLVPVSWRGGTWRKRRTRGNGDTSPA